MSGRTPRGDGYEGREGRGSEARRGTARAQLPLLDRLLDDAPGTLHDTPLSAGDAMMILRRSVRRDLEALLNARRRWASWNPELRELASSPIGFGIPDFTTGGYADLRRREALRADIERSIRRFEPRLASVRVSLLDSGNGLESTLRLRIDGLLHADPAPEPIAFDTLVDPTTADVVVRPSSEL